MTEENTNYASDRPLLDKPKKHIPTFVGIVIIVVVTILLFGGVFVWQYLAENAPKNTPVEAPIVNGTEDWQTYINTQYGFELKLPDSWSGFITRESPNKITFCIKILNPITKTIPGYSCLFNISIKDRLQWEKDAAPCLNGKAVMCDWINDVVGKNNKYVFSKIVAVQDYNDEEYPYIQDVSKVFFKFLETNKNIISAGSSSSPITCGGNIDCFINASKTCAISTYTSDYGTSFEIKGLQNNNCIVYRGFTKDECPFRITDLTNILKNWKIGNFSTNDWQTCPQQFVPQVVPVSSKNEPTCTDANTARCLNPLCTVNKAKLVADTKIKEMYASPIFETQSEDYGNYLILNYNFQYSGQKNGMKYITTIQIDKETCRYSGYSLGGG